MEFQAAANSGGTSYYIPKNFNPLSKQSSLNDLNDMIKDIRKTDEVTRECIIRKDKAFFCRACSVDLNSEAMAKSHAEGRKHLNAVKR